MTSAWVAFWNGSHSIYVNGRHKDVHYRLIAEAIAALVPGRDAGVRSTTAAAKRSMPTAWRQWRRGPAM
jgi:hypothetical protein